MILILALSALKTGTVFSLPPANALLEVIYLSILDYIPQILLYLSCEVLKLWLVPPELEYFFRLHLSCQFLQVDGYHIIFRCLFFVLLGLWADLHGFGSFGFLGAAHNFLILLYLPFIPNDILPFLGIPLRKHVNLNIQQREVGLYLYLLRLILHHYIDHTTLILSFLILNTLLLINRRVYACSPEVVHVIIVQLHLHLHPFVHGGLVTRIVHSLN